MYGAMVWCYDSARRLQVHAIPLRVCSAMSGTDLAYAAILLCVCYAICGTGLAYAADQLYARAGQCPMYAAFPTRLRSAATPI
eukprot:2729722-Rhodomonas_salina.1